MIRNCKNMISTETSFKTIVVVAFFLFQFKFSPFIKPENQLSLISYTIQQNFSIQNQVWIVRNSKNMISKETSFKTIVVVSIFLLQFKFSQLVKSERQVFLISNNIQRINRFKTKFRYFVIVKI